jgi:hypothetical protein
MFRFKETDANSDSNYMSLFDHLMKKNKKEDSKKEDSKNNKKAANSLLSEL